MDTQIHKDDIEYKGEYKKCGLEVNISKLEYMCVDGIQQSLFLEDGKKSNPAKQHTNNRIV